MTASMRQRTDIGITTGWNRRHPGLERGLTVIAACFVLLSVAPVVSIAIVVTNSSSCNGTDCAATGMGDGNERSQEVRNVSEHGGHGDTCFTAACNDTATMILNNMDGNVDPCDNFYKFACGGYLKSTKIPDDLSYVDSYISTELKVEEQLRTILAAEIEPNEPKAYKLVKKYYKSCMNESAIEARGVQPLLAALQRIGGWPVVEGASWYETNFDWIEAIYELRNSGHYFQSIINLHVAVKQLNRTKHIDCIISPASASFSYQSGETDFTNETLRMRDFILDVATSLGAQNNTGSKEELEETMKFQYNLLMIPRSETTNNNTAATRMTLMELKRNYPSIPWQKYICKMLPPTVSIPKNQVFIVESPIYFARLDKLMSNTPKRVLANYIAQTAALTSIQYLNKEMLEKHQQLSAVFQSGTMAPPRWKVCLESVFSLPLVLESMYVSQHLSADTKNYVVSMMDNVGKAIRKMLETANWLDQLTKSRVLQKFDAMYGYITYVDQLPDDKLDKIYEKLEMDEEKYYENAHTISFYHMKYPLGKLQQTVAERDAPSTIRITDVTGRYFLYNNSFALAVGMLQDNFFSKDRPRYMNYGALGYNIGHEIIHAFDTTGTEFDEKKEAVDWWQQSSEEEFSKRAQCMIDQYSNYTVQEVGLNVNGMSTVGENIADNGGIKGAYLAYNNWVAKNREEPKLPGIDMTANQLFWISTANVMCAKSTTSNLLSIINDETHSPWEVRIIGSMSNNPEFAKDFKCPPGSKMNPTEKCTLW